MADKIIPNLPKIVATTFDDLLLVVDTPAESPTNKKITLANFFNKIPTSLGYGTEAVTTGTNALTIADGTQNGQLKYIVMKTENGVGTLTGSNLVGLSIVFNNAGIGQTLIWTDSKWYSLSSGIGGATWLP